jgi:hypothetical protein
LPARAFDGISRDAFERIKDDLRARGVAVPPGDTCMIEHRGVRGSMRYSEPDRRVEIAILEKPFYVPEGMVWNLLDAAMRRYDVAPDKKS